MQPWNSNTLTAATRHIQEELKHQYNKNIRVFHKTRGVELMLIQQLELAVEENYNTTMNIRTTGQLKGTFFMIIQYLIVTYGKISPIKLINLEQNTK